MARGTYNIGEETEEVEFKKSTGELKEGIKSIAFKACDLSGD